MKSILVFLSLISFNSIAQSSLNFNKRFIECEDEWVVFNKTEKDTEFIFGFIYIDPDAGLTFNFEGAFKIDQNYNFIPNIIEGANIKTRLTPNNLKVAILPQNKLEELKLDSIPSWLKYYKRDTGTSKSLYKLGFLYNSWGESEKALTYLLRAYEKDPKYEGLELELGFTYNALKEFEKAIGILKLGVATDSMNCDLYKELSFAEAHLSRMEDASKDAIKGIQYCSHNELKSEIAINIAQQYFKLKDKNNFSIWENETKKWALNGSMILKVLESMRKVIDEK